MIGLLEYGCGNLRSLENALEAVDLPSRRVGDPGGLAGVDRLILPGVGHFGHAVGNLRARGLEGAVRAFAARGGPLLGICLGMQLLFEGSDEAPGVEGLGLLAGRFRSFEDPALKVPHMGWSAMEWEGSTRPVYFVHSYFLAEWTDPSPSRLGLASYGRPFVAAFRAGCLAGFQFHPEKSGLEGLALLKEALTWS